MSGSLKFCTILVATLLVCGVASAAEVGLTSVLFPEGKTIAVPMSGTQRAPAANVSATVRHQSGQSAITIKYSKLEPAVLFGGDSVAYTLWAVAPDGTVENLGGVANSSNKGSAQYSTAKRDFALMITAEPIVSVRSPSTHVVFFSGAPSVKGIQPQAFTYGGLSDRKGLVDVGKDSIAGMTFKPEKGQTIELLQAEKAIELLRRFQASSFDKRSTDEANAAITEARESKGKKQTDASNRAVTFAGQALAKTRQMLEAEAAAMREAQIAAERQALATVATGVAGQLSVTAADLQETQARLERTQSELSRTQTELQTRDRDRARLMRQQQALESQLLGALSDMSTGMRTDRGLVVSISGTAFPSGKADLTTVAKYALAKLSGMLLVFPDMKLSIEGYTDSTGGEDLNRKLSVSRAKAVQTFLGEMGVGSTRMSSRGYGPDNPIAPNDTPEGRAKNRRVDIVMTGVR